MPMLQVLHVVRCYKCETFQVDIVKKSTKWTCKLCQEKQSLTKVYGRGTGIHCRGLVQYFNRERLNQESVLSVSNHEAFPERLLYSPDNEEKFEANTANGSRGSVDEIKQQLSLSSAEGNIQSSTRSTENSEWAKYLDENEERRNSKRRRSESSDLRGSKRSSCSSGFFEDSS